MKQQLFFSFLFSFFYSHQIFSQQSKAYTLIIGLKHINDKKYETVYHKKYDEKGISGVDADCIKMQKIASDNHHMVTTLRDKEATKANILKEIKSIGNKISQDDMFTIYFSGHGDTIPDISGDEESKYDEVLVAYDDYVVDDEIDLLLRKYFTKTKNIMIVDACHSGTSNKIFLALDFVKSTNKKNIFINETKARNQQVDFPDCNYDKMEKIDEPYNLIYFGATPDDTTAAGDETGGLFTYWFSKTIKDAQYTGSWRGFTYRKLACKVGSKLLSYNQKLIYREIGKDVNMYNNNQPFKIY